MRQFIGTFGASAALFAVLAGAVPVHAQTTRPSAAVAGAATPAKAVTFDSYIKGEIAAALDALQAGGSIHDAIARTAGIFDQVVARGTEKQLDLFRESDFALRLALQMKDVPDADRTDLVKFLRTHDNLAHTLVFLLDGDDSPKSVYTLLNRLREKRGDQLEKYATLTAAICVVHDRPFSRRLNENVAKSADPLAIWDYYAINEDRMYFGIRSVPAELLIWVVDTTASIPDMQWALSKYGRDDTVGRHFFDIKYDTGSFMGTAEKQLDSAGGYTLPNILKFGGVCVDQAYFAASVGKAIGVPTAIAGGHSADVGHAWVGFLQSRNGNGWWNFDTGRYEEYKGVRGEVQEPRTRQEIPDAFVSLSAELISAKPVDRQNAAALAHAAAYLINLAKDGQEIAPMDLPDTVPQTKQVRKATVEAELELLHESLKANPGHAPAWAAVQALAQDGKLTMAQKITWSNELLQRCGAKYPDFALAVLIPMIQTVNDPKEQDARWQAAFQIFKNRFDLAATIRMAEAQLWEDQKDTAKAGQCYMDVIERYVNAGPFVIPALEGAEKLLRDSGKTDRVPALYEQAWRACHKPDDMAGVFMRQSNWYRVGALLVDRLGEANQKQRAAAVAGQLDGAAAR